LTASAYRPFAVSNKDRIVGLFVIGALFIFLLGFIIPMVRDLADEEQLTFYTQIERTYGITSDALVSLKGVTVGKVVSVELSSDGSVRVDIALSDAYADFYTSDLLLRIDSEIGVNSILNGAGLVLVPGLTRGQPLDDGAFIETELPQGLASILETIDIEQLTQQITTIVTSVESIASGIAGNQQQLYTTMDNLAAVTTELKTLSKDLPEVFDSINTSLEKLDSTIGTVDSLLDGSSDDIAVAIANTAELTRQANETLKQTEQLLSSGEPAVEQLPKLMRTTNSALESIDELSQTLNRSWLFGGRKKTTNKAD
jgi:ABC-type transporter Mla subunit MlaD